MSPEYILFVGRQAILIALLVAAPMLGMGLIVGLVISIIQAVTQINEMTLTFIPKIIAVAVALLVFMPWMLRLITDFTRRLLENLPQLAR